MSKIVEGEKELQAKLDSLQGPEWDSSDDENLKEVVEDTKKTTRSKTSKKSSSQYGSVLYIGHLPRQFEEHELLQFLKQFGRVLNVRVCRSRKTGNSKGYAFVRMQSAAVANIVADTLSGYILFGQKRLVCHVVPPDKVHKKLFFPIKLKSTQKQPREKSLKKMKVITSRLVEREKKKRNALKERGIDYDFPGYEASQQQQQENDTEEPIIAESKRKDSSASTESTTKKKKRKDSVGSTEDSKSTKKKRKDSEASVESGVGESPRKSTKKKRKDSMASVESTDSTGSKRRRKESDASAKESDEVKTRSSSKKKENKIVKDAEERKEPKGSQSEKKEKRKTKTKKRRTSAP